MLWITLGGVGILFLIAIAGLLAATRSKRRNTLTSIVMMRTSPRGLTEAEVRGAARRAVPRDGIDVMSIPWGSEQPAGLAGGYAVMLGQMPGFYVIDSIRPYCDDPSAESRKFEDPRCREAFANHTSWVSVDIVGGMPPKSVQAGVTGLMARLAAELLDDGCTLIYATHLSRVALPGPDTERALRSDDPMSIFGDDEANMPIINVEKGEAKIERAMEEARRRWPDFVKAWARRGPACAGLVKGRFTTTDGGNEFIWVEVAQAADTHATGKVLNKPANVKGLKMGDSTRVQFADIADWVYKDGEKPVGLFVERLLRKV